MDLEYSKEQLDQMRAYYGLDQPVFTQLVQTVKKNLKGDLGLSIHYKKPVAAVLRERLPWSLSVMGAALILSLAPVRSWRCWGCRRNGSIERFLRFCPPLRRYLPI